MLLRIALIVTILAGAGALYFSHFNVQTRITTLESDISQARDEARAARRAEQEAKAAQQEAIAELEETDEVLAQTQAELEVTTANLNEQRERADQLAADLTETTRERNQARDALARFEATGVPPEEIVQQRDLLREARAERDAYIEENNLLSRQVQRLQSRLELYEEGTAEVALPPGLKGRVLAVDPKYNFVVLDIGGDEEVVENGKMLVMRDGQLVGKVRVTQVHPDQSIANIIPEWQQDQVMEGDLVIY